MALRCCCVLLATSVLIAVTTGTTEKRVNGDVESRQFILEDVPDYEILHFPMVPVASFRRNTKKSNRPKITVPIYVSTEETVSDKPSEIVVQSVIPVVNHQNKPAIQSVKPATAQQSTKPTANQQVALPSKPASSQQIVIKPTVVKPASPASSQPVKPAVVKPSGNKPASPTSTQSGQPVKPAVVKPTAAQPVQSNGPCKCVSGVCMCCTGAVLDYFQQKVCTKVMYSPEDFAFDFSMMLNNRVMYNNKFSGKNPAPACARVPRTNIRMCVKFSNVYFAGRNLHMCMGLEANWDYFQIFSFQFDCIRMGSNGFAVVAPEEGGGLPGGINAIIDAGDDIAEYDENVVRTAYAA